MPALTALVAEIRAAAYPLDRDPAARQRSGRARLEAEVRPRIEAALRALDDVQVIVYEPHGAPASDTMKHRREVPKMTAGRAALVELMHRYLGGLLDPFVTLLEVHKLMYFMQEAGEPLQAALQGRAVRPLCREPAPRAARDRRAPDLGLRRRRRCAGQAA